MGTFSLWHLLIVIGLIGGGVIFILNTNRLFSSGFKKEGSNSLSRLLKAQKCRGHRDNPTRIRARTRRRNMGQPTYSGAAVRQRDHQEGHQGCPAN